MTAGELPSLLAISIFYQLKAPRSTTTKSMLVWVEPGRVKLIRIYCAKFVAGNNAVLHRLGLERLAVDRDLYGRRRGEGRDSGDRNSAWVVFARAYLLHRISPYEECYRSHWVL